jgi:predicted DNA-binding ribbon-helix-helix protein
MEKRIRGKNGKYISKGTSCREVRSVRLTDFAWQALNDQADSQKVTVADLLEEWMLDNHVIHDKKVNLSGVVGILEEALKLKPNAGGAIKARIREALETIQEFM